MQHQDDQLLIDQFLLDWDDFSLGSRADEYESSPEDQHLEKYLEHDRNCDILHSLSGMVLEIFVSDRQTDYFARAARSHSTSSRDRRHHSR